MKQIYAILILGLLIFDNSFGQDFKKIDYQFDFGTTLTIPYKKSIEIWPEFDGHPKTDYSSAFGYYFELMISYHFNSKIAINSGFNYNYNTLKINDKIGLTENKGSLTSSYLNLPILVKYRLSNNIPISISAGPYLGLMISANEKGTSYFDTASLVFAEPDPAIQLIEPIQKYDRNIKKDYASIDFGLSVQLDYELKLSKGLTGVIMSRFNYGFKDVITNDLVNNNTANDWRNYNLMIGLGIKL